MRHLLSAAAAATVLMMATAASAQPYSGHPGAPYAPSASVWRPIPYSAARTYRDERAYYGGARYDFRGRHDNDYALAPNPRYGGAYKYAPNRTFGGWGARFTIPFRSHTQSHR